MYAMFYRHDCVCYESETVIFALIHAIMKGWLCLVLEQRQPTDSLWCQGLPCTMPGTEHIGATLWGLKCSLLDYKEQTVMTEGLQLFMLKQCKARVLHSRPDWERQLWTHEPYRPSCCIMLLNTADISLTEGPSGRMWLRVLWVSSRSSILFIFSELV